ncbi:MAG: hypothetical protein CMH26_03980 [Micavibrio sp.]|nr:hypothetical protein [Micavibrio sp.]|tara:strand:- start:245 stop:901 length:657 start_codon:yes stop_codon:yes gene_type:complete
MRFISKTLLSLSLVLSLGTQNALAEVYVWEAEDGQVSVSFPDRWARLHNQKPSDLLTVKAPGDNSYAMCKISAREDGRFKIYPRRFESAIHKLNFSKAMWEDYYQGQDNTIFHDVRDDAQLSYGYATYARVSFETAVGPKMQKRGLAFASLFDNKLYIVECSAEKDAYEKWHNSFMSFIKAVTFPHNTNLALTGYYKNFLDDCLFKVEAPDFVDDYHY